MRLMDEAAAVGRHALGLVPDQVVGLGRVQRVEGAFERIVVVRREDHLVALVARAEPARHLGQELVQRRRLAQGQERLADLLVQPRRAHRRVEVLRDAHEVVVLVLGVRVPGRLLQLGGEIPPARQQPALPGLVVAAAAQVRARSEKRDHRPGEHAVDDDPQVLLVGNGAAHRRGYFLPLFFIFFLLADAPNATPWASWWTSCWLWT